MAAGQMVMDDADWAKKVEAFKAERRARVASAIMRVVANADVEPKGKWLEAADAAIEAFAGA